MTRSLHSLPITIFEGCDGSGKTTAATRYAVDTGARYVHLGPFPRVTTGLGRLYTEAMLPAVLGYQPVVMDRSWLSEGPYGSAFREGDDRLGEASQRMLERLALRCGARVVLCKPPWEKVVEIYNQRQQREVLNGQTVGLERLKQVYETYMDTVPALPRSIYDYTSGASITDHLSSLSRNPCHPLATKSAGNLEGKYVFVGQDFAPHKNQDPLYQWPFASFSGEGCSQWLTEQLITMNIREEHILWINADELANLPGIHEIASKARRIVAFGEVAMRKCLDTITGEGRIQFVEHPQYWKRFRAKEPFRPLLRGLQL